MTTLQPHIAALDEVVQIPFKSLPTAGSAMVVFEGAGAPRANLPFVPVRVFTVHATDISLRGHHAHRACHQILICLRGHCWIRYTDGVTWREADLTKPTVGLHIPPAIWAEQNYYADTILLALCNRPFEESDYLRTFDEFLAYRHTHRQP